MLGIAVYMMCAVEPPNHFFELLTVFSPLFSSFRNDRSANALITHSFLDQI